MPGCIRCSNANTCTTCNSVGYIMNMTTKRCVVQNCLNTICYECDSTLLRCTSCPNGMSLSDGTCIVRCGDNALNGSEKCDDGNLKDGDGCSSTCTF